MEGGGTLAERQYDEKYAQEGLYWGLKPSSICFEVLKLLPAERPLSLLDIGCGEGRNALFFARNGYVVDAFDVSQKGVDKTSALFADSGFAVNVFKAGVADFRLTRSYDILFSSAVFHFIPHELRAEIMENYKKHTAPGGLNVFSIFVKKPFISSAPDKDAGTHHWISGELFTYYHDWRIEFCCEEVFDCNSGGKPHQHAMNRIIARKI